MVYADIKLESLAYVKAMGHSNCFQLGFSPLEIAPGNWTYVSYPEL